VNDRFQIFAHARSTLIVCLSLGDARDAKALYDVKPDEIPGRPGTIIRLWPLEGGGPSGSNANAFRVLYRSTGLNGEPVAVSGAIFVPAAFGVLSMVSPSN
jgi:hypothetical protein